MSSPSHNAKDSRRYLAVSEKRYFDHHAYISFYDFNKNILTPKYLKTVNISEFVYQAIYRKNANHHSGDDKNKAGQEDDQPQKNIVSLSFSSDNKYLAIVLSDKNLDTKALIYDWQTKNKLIASYDFYHQEITKISFNPKDWQQICTSGPNHWRVWRMQESSFKQVPQFQKIRQDRHFTDHCWLGDDKLLVGTQLGELIYVDNFEQKQVIENAYITGGLGQGPIGEDGKVLPPMNVALIKPYSLGFFVASDNGYMALWVRSEENNSTSGKQTFDFIRKWKKDATKNVKILSLDVAPSEDYIAISLENNNIGIVLTKSIGLNEDPNKEIKFDLVCKGFHSGQISSIDIAV